MQYSSSSLAFPICGTSLSYKYSLKVGPLGSTGSPRLLYIGDAQGHFCGGHHSLVQVIAKVTHTEEVPFAWRAIARSVATEVVSEALAENTEPSWLWYTMVDERNREIQVFGFRVT